MSKMEIFKQVYQEVDGTVLRPFTIYKRLSSPCFFDFYNWCFFLKTAAPCRWTYWMNLESGGVSDRETLTGLLSKYGSIACLKPSNIIARRYDTKEVANKSVSGRPSTPQVNCLIAVLYKWMSSLMVLFCLYQL